ncbi:MAG TPA: ATP-binding cassette domain-containing protein [Conexibacter sp.]|nr:ATP-binding cassette domain-containing protein [Conexibacter sp.]
MTPPLLSLEAVSKTYRRGPYELHVLREVSLELFAGEFIAVYGQRSAGKTTLLKVAGGFEAPDAGCVRFQGRDLASATRRRLAGIYRAQIGWVRRFGPESRELRALDFVKLPLLGAHRLEEAERRSLAALARVGAEDCALETWANLADAERALVAIAHALVREPALLLADDPTAGLDVLERERILALLRRTADKAGVGVLMVVPELPAMLRAHDVRSLSDGRLLAPEPPPGSRATVIDFPGGERSA